MHWFFSSALGSGWIRRYDMSEQAGRVSGVCGVLFTVFLLVAFAMAELPAVAMLEPIAAQGGLRLVPTTTLDAYPQLDLVCVPGGPGMNPLLTDDDVLAFLRRQAAGAHYVTAVCTGALVLGAAGLLKGYRATTHWLSIELLPVFGATAAADRVVIDRNRIEPDAGACTGWHTISPSELPSHAPSPCRPAASRSVTACNGSLAAGVCSSAIRSAGSC